MSRVEDPAKLLRTAAHYIRDLATSLGNACEFFEGDADDDPQATVEVEEARAFVERIKAYLSTIKE